MGDIHWLLCMGEEQAREALGLSEKLPGLLYRVCGFEPHRMSEDVEGMDGER